MSTSTTDSGEEPSTRRSSERRDVLVRRDLIAGTAMLAVVALFLGTAGEGGTRDWLFPKALSYTLGVLAVLLVGRGLLRLGDQMPLVPVVLRGQGVDVALFTAMAIVYAVVMPRLGFWVTTGLFLFGAAVYLDTRRSRRGTIIAAAVAVAVCVVGYQVLTRVFFVGFPEGVLF